MIKKEITDRLKNDYLLDILKGADVRASSAMVAYARYLNTQDLRYNNFPLYLKIFESNNKYAIDALLKGYTPENYLEVIIVPNNYVIENIFRLLENFLSREMYPPVLRIFCGFLSKTYRQPDEGIRYYVPTIADINNLGKSLHEEEDQDFPLNRVILDILSFISDLDSFSYQSERELTNIARQASRIRSDYFDSRRKLIQSITEVILRKAENPEFGVVPDAEYIE